MSHKPKIVLFGGGHQASYTLEIIELENKYDIIGVIDSKAAIGADCYGYPVIGRQTELTELINRYSIEGGIISIGDNWSRKIVYDAITAQVPDFNFVTAIHPTVIIGKNTTIGKGTVIMAGCIINLNSTIGEFCFFATGAQIDHDCKVDEFASISAGSMTGGKVHIQRFSALTLGVTVVDRVTIGESSVVGAGSVVLNDIPANVLAYGSPAKVIRTREAHEKFLK